MAVVLVVDDHPQVLRTVCHSLRAAGHETLTATRADEAIRLAQRHRPHVVLLDLKLSNGDADGVSLFKSIRAEQPETIGILMTGFGSYLHALDCGREGMLGYIAKPFEPRDIVKLVADTVARAHGVSREPGYSTSVTELRRVLSLIGTDAASMTLCREALVRTVTDPAADVPLFLTCAATLGSLVSVRSFDAEDTTRWFVALRNDLEQVIALNAKPRPPGGQTALALLDAAAQVGGELPSEENLAAAVYLSASHLSRVIRAATAFRYTDLVRGYRVRRAVPVVVHSAEHLSQIAFAAGYEDIRAFNRDFNEVFGVSPTELRRITAAKRATQP